MRLGVNFSERMSGYLSPTFDESLFEQRHTLSSPQLLPYKRAYEDGLANNDAIELKLFVEMSDVEQPDQEFGVSGTCSASLFSTEPLMVRRGRMKMMVPAAGDVHARILEYELPLTSVRGDTFLLSGFKWVKNTVESRWALCRRIIDLLSDTTMMFFEIKRITSQQLVAGGIMRIGVFDIAKLLCSMRATCNSNQIPLLSYQTPFSLVRFGLFFAKQCIDVYAHELKPLQALPNTPVNVDSYGKSKLREPEVHSVQTLDGVELLLLRYTSHKAGGDPVVIGHGMTQSSRLFDNSVVPENLTEYLLDAGFDVWLMNLRYSAIAKDPFVQGRVDTFDAIAQFDIPAQLQFIRKQTGFDKVHVITFCVSGLIFSASLLGGWTKSSWVQSTVFLAMAMDLHLETMNKLKAHLPIVPLLKILGLKSLAVHPKPNAEVSWAEYIVDRVIDLWPHSYENRTNDEINHRAAFFFGDVFHTENISRATLDSMPDHYGVAGASLSAWESLVIIAQNQHLVDAKHRNVYLSPEQLRSGMNMPVQLITGELNRCLLPSGVIASYLRLVKANGPRNINLQIVPGYGHLDLLLGENAHKDVFPLITQHLQDQLIQ